MLRKIGDDEKPSMSRRYAFAIISSFLAPARNDGQHAQVRVFDKLCFLVVKAAGIGELIDMKYGRPVIKHQPRHCDW